MKPGFARPPETFYTELRFQASRVKTQQAELSLNAPVPPRSPAEEVQAENTETYQRGQFDVQSGNFRLKNTSIYEEFSNSSLETR